VPSQTHTPRVLTIAGSDSGGGAGIQADLKAFARCGVHGMSAITAITAQSTVEVRAIHAVPPEMVLAQVRAVREDIGVDAVKVGMLGSVEVTLAVARALRELPAGTPVVVDPVMVAESGARLLEVDAQRALVAEILPLASVLTPNVPEARVLVGWSEAGVSEARESAAGGSAALADMEDGAALADADAERLARAVLALGPRAVVLTGGHRGGADAGRDADADAGAAALTVDLFVSAADGQRGEVIAIVGPRHPGGAAHGSGCTHSSVLAAQLALGHAPLAAARVARRLAGDAVARGLRDVGAGAGPVDVLGLERLRGGIIDQR